MEMPEKIYVSTDEEVFLEPYDKVVTTEYTRSSTILATNQEIARLAGNYLLQHDLFQVGNPKIIALCKRILETKGE